MFEIATFSPKDMLQLPIGIAKKFNVADRFIVWIEGDILHLKRMRTSPLRIVEQSPEGEPFSLDEINTIVHQVRQKRRQQHRE